MLKATTLRCEYLNNPIGIGVKSPRFSWIIDSDKRNVFQTSYEVHVSKDKDFKDLVWNSGSVESDKSVHVCYEGTQLQSASRYYYKVRITDNYGEKSEFSETAIFETTLFSNDEWQAQFITAEGSDDGKSSKGTLLRKEFELDKEIEAASVYATALGMYELHINGERVGDALFTPGWTAYNKRLQFQTYDMSNMLKRGRNAIGATLGAGWYKGDLAGWIGRRNVYDDKTALLLQLKIRFKDGSESVIVSDDLKAEQLDDGGVPFVIPDVLSNNLQTDKLVKEEHSATGWADAAVICPWTVYQIYGDVEVLKEQYETMKKWVGYIRSKAEEGLIWNTGFHFGDWVALDAKEGSYFGATPNDLIATAYYAYSTKLLIKTAQVLGKLDDAAIYEKLYADIVQAFRNEFYTQRGRLAARTQTAHILSLMFDLTPAEHKKRTIKELLKLLEENKGHLTTGFLGTPYFLHVLSGNEQLDAAYDLLLKEDFPSWLYQVKMGATTEGFCYV